MRQRSSTTRPWLLSLSFAALAIVSPAFANDASRPNTPTTEQQLQLGLEAQAVRDYGAMLVHLRQAAARGNVEAMEMLSLALLVGPTLYGPAVKADRCEAAVWLRQAAAQGSLVGIAQLDFLNRLRPPVAQSDPCAARSATRPSR